MKHLILCLLSATGALAVDSVPAPAQPVAPAPLTKSENKPYPLKTCIVSDEDLGSMDGQTSIVYEGRIIKFCCKDCIPNFQKDPAKYLAKIGVVPTPVQPATPAPNTKSVNKPYPLKTCIVSDEDLGAMDEQTSIVYEGRVIKFCCKECLPKFQKDPAKYLKKLEGK